jgi:hypothetical protein
MAFGQKGSRTQTGSPLPTVEEVRAHHVDLLNAAIRRPGAFGGETALALLADVVAFVDGRVAAIRDERDRLARVGAADAVGVRGPLVGVLPENVQGNAVASVYADIAQQNGWLVLDRPGVGRPQDDVPGNARYWAGADRTLSQLLTAFGAPALRIGGTNPYFPATLGYGSADGSLVWFHLWNDFALAPGVEGRAAPVHPEPVVLAVRHGTGRFLDTFTFTPEGRARRPVTR